MPACVPAAAREPLTRGREPGGPGPGQVTKALAELAARATGLAPPTRITVPTWVHVLTDGRRKASPEAVTAQLDTLNAAYGGRHGGVDTGVRFQLEGTTTARHTGWFTNPLGHEAAIKQRLRRGGPGTLNLYVGQLTALVLGYATYPHWYEGRPELDGVFIDWRTLPGGPLRDFNRGYTGVHEIGHWLGLFHTFENGCDEPGDGIADTPPEGKATEGCPASKDTCPGGGPDPLHNYMDYAHDRCMSEFTPGQAARMHEMWAAFRMSDAR